MKLQSPSNEINSYNEASKAVAQLKVLYDQARLFLIDGYNKFAKGDLSARCRAFYPEIRIHVTSHVSVDSRLSFGHVPNPGIYSATITQPELFEYYLEKQIELLMKSHNVPVSVGYSTTPMPLHFAVAIGNDHLDFADEDKMRYLRDYFDVPDLDTTHDEIVNGEDWRYDDGASPISSFTAQRVDYSLARLAHYTATNPKHFQNFVLFTNYQFYIDEFVNFAQTVIDDEHNAYYELVSPGNGLYTKDEEIPANLKRGPQMPAYHLKRKGGFGITMINIGVGPSNAKTITDHVAVLRPHAWIMLGHCAGLRSSQRLGDYVLAHAYMREDNVLDADIPPWIPLPALSEIQRALEDAVAETTELKDYELKRVMRTGTVASVDNRNWELVATSGPVKRLNQARAIALDMESATIAANGFRLRVPYGTLLCVSDKPLHGELKLPGMATDFYNTQVAQHLKIGILAMEKLGAMPLAQLHSRKLRSFNETPFL